MEQSDRGNERTPLLGQRGHGDPQLDRTEDSYSCVESSFSKEEQAMGNGAIGERLAYNDYTTIDWMHDLVKDSQHYRLMKQQKGFRPKIALYFDSATGWIAAALIGTLTAVVAFVVDIAVATVSDWKLGYCTENWLMNIESCCTGKTPLVSSQLQTLGETCPEFHVWTSSYASSYAIYVALALGFGLLSGAATMTTRASLPRTTSDETAQITGDGKAKYPVAGKTMYMAAGSGIPELKTILSGFVIPHFLGLKVLAVKAFGAIFAVATGMCLGKEGPFVHISACVGHLVASRFGKYRENSRKMREILSVACAAGLSVAFGAPLGGVLFTYEEISTYFPRKVLWRAFLCSLFASVILKVLNPTGTGKLVLFETNYGTSYHPSHYAAFVGLGIAGGVFGGAFCKLNHMWAKWFRSFGVIKNHPLLEILLVVAVTTLVQYPNPLIRNTGDIVMKDLLVNCQSDHTESEWICQHEKGLGDRWEYVGWLFYGTSAKLMLTVITFGIKVPSGIIIPALDAGALFGRLVGQWITTISPGIFAMVGAGAFLAGVSRMTISLCVIMFELTGELEYVLPHMIAILVAKWTADAISGEGVYDLAQAVLGHPFLDLDTSLKLAREHNALVEDILPPRRTMDEITVQVPSTNRLPRKVLEGKLSQLERRGLLDAGLVLVQDDGRLQGYIGESELKFGLSNAPAGHFDDSSVRLLGLADQDDGLDLSSYVDRTPFTICAKAPMEYAVEMFGKLGLKQLMVLEEGTGKLVGVIIKKRMVTYLDNLKMEA